MREYSDYIVYVDESGDHGLKSIDSTYPVFVLAFCIFRKTEYAIVVTPKLQQLKFRHFGHDIVVLHERDIRKAKGDFKFLVNRKRREAFMSDLSRLVEESPMTLIAVIIEKESFKKKGFVETNPYHVALGAGIRRLHSFLSANTDATRLAHIVFEKRGRKEDIELELEFRRLVDAERQEGSKFHFEAVFADKKTNSGGLQLADLMARPIGRHLLKPDQKNRAYDVLRSKLYRGPDGEDEDLGLHCLP